jgi:creatinine amidohydrolase
VAQADDPDRTGGCVFAHPVNRTSANGVTGHPSRATLDKGQRWFDWLATDLTELVTRGSREEPPLDASYFSRDPLACRH